MKETDEAKSLDNQAFVSIWKDLLNTDDLDAHIGGHFLERRPFIELVKRYVRKCNANRPKVLEAGCGTATDSYIIAHNTNAEVYAVDKLPEALQVAEKIGDYFDTPIKLVLGDALNLKFEDKTFDLVFSQGLIEHFLDPVPALKEQIRVLRDSGYLIVDVPQKFNPYTISKHKHIKKRDWLYGWETEYSYWELKALGRKLGLKVVGAGAHGYDQAYDYGLGRVRFWGKRILQGKSVLRPLAKAYDRFWKTLEKHFGHYFMLNISMVYVKEESGIRR